MERIRRGWLMAVVVPLLAALLAGCAAGAPTSGKPADAGQAPSSGEAKKVRIGITQIAEHPALDAARKGFQDALNEKGWGDKVTYDYQNAQGEMPSAQTIAEKFVADKDDLILAIATPTAQAAAKATADIPILITAVTDPVTAGLVKSLAQPGTNVTGTTDMNPVDRQIELLTQLVPGAKKVGVIYNAGEVNSGVQVKMVKEAAQKLGLTVVEATVANTNDVSQAAQSLVGRVHAIYVPTDNTVVSAAAAVIQVAEKAKLPVIAGERSVVDAGGLATIGIDYYKLGRQTGEMAIQVLQGKKPADLPVESQKEYAVVVNGKAAKALGLMIPQAILDQAEVLQ